MIQKLINNIIIELETELNDLINKSEIIILNNNATENIDKKACEIYLSSGKLTINQKFNDSIKPQLSTQYISETLEINLAEKHHKYQLKYEPIEHSIRYYLLIDNQEKVIEENKDFKITQKKKDIDITIENEQLFSKATKIILKYSYIEGLISLQEFKQELLINITEEKSEKLEEITSLITAIIITNQQTFIDNYNNSSNSPTQYRSKTVLNTHTISEISFREGIYLNQQTPLIFQLKFDIIGQLKMIRIVGQDFAQAIKEVII